MFQEIILSSVRILVGYILLLVLTRITGRKMVSQITFFDFVVAIIIGSVVANMSVNFDKPIVSGVTVLLVLTLMTVLLQFSLIKSIFLRKIIDFQSIILIENGRINARELKKARMRLDNLMMLLRENGAFNISDVEYAILETDGQLSVLKKSQKQPVTPSDLNISTGYAGIMRDIIMDGKVLDVNLSAVNLDRKWLMKKLEEKNYHSIEEVFYAGLDTAGGLYISAISRGGQMNSQGGIA